MESLHSHRIDNTKYKWMQYNWLNSKMVMETVICVRKHSIQAKVDRKGHIGGI